MAVSRRPARTRYLVLVLVLAAITLVTINTGGGRSGWLATVRAGVSSGLATVAHGTHVALAPVGNFLSGAVHYGALVRENQHLRDQVASMQAAQASAAAASQLARQTLAEAHLDFAAGVPQIAAQVINQGQANFENGFEINRGTSSGVALGYPVVAAGGLIGSVSAVTRHHATVKVLTDSTFNVGVMIPHSQAVGAVSGFGPGSPLRAADIPAGTPLHKGEVLSTSGLQGEMFPPGIPVARVTSVSTPPGALQESVALAPLVNPDRALVVQVLVWSSQTPRG